MEKSMVDNQRSWLTALVIALITFYVVKLWMRVAQFPRGPIPLPLIGNLLKFRKNESVKNILLKIKEQYGGIFTLWLAHEPFVIVTDWELTKEALITKKNDFISRPSHLRSVNYMRDQFAGIVFEQNSRKWEVSRKVAAGAIRKFADGERLACLVQKYVAAFSQKVFASEKSINPSQDIQQLIIDIITETAFGGENIFPEDNYRLTELYDQIQALGGNTPGDVSLLLLVLFYKRDQAMKRVSIQFGEFLGHKFNLNKITFKRGEIRNFADAVLAAGLEAEEEEKSTKEFLDDTNMMKILGVLFIAGTETTATSLRWIILFLARFPEVQRRIREEIKRHIGQRMPLQSDRKNCDYSWAFISESLRFRPPLNIGVPHVTGINTELGGKKIPKGTTVIFVTEIIQSDPLLWKNPLEFKPERFLDKDGKYCGKKMNGFMAFGEGKRICVGETLARNDLFLILANLIQKAEIGLDIPLETVDLEPQNNILIAVPKVCNITFKPIQIQ